MRTPAHLSTLIAALVVCPIVGVLVLADSAREHDGVTAAVDPLLAADAADVRSDPLTALAKLLTLIGSEAVIGVLALLLIIALLERRGPFFALSAGVAMALSASLTLGVKQVVGRQRPGSSIRLGPADPTYSFPSGHTLNSAVFLGLVVILLMPLMRARRRRIAIDCCLTSLAIGIGLSRLYLGYHWASDVMGSWLLAIAVLALVSLALRIRGTALLRPRSGGGQVDAPSVTP